MISLFKSKPLLKDLIPSGYVDIHSHLLPGIDDGAKTLEDTLALMQGMKEIGIEKIITTPHIFTNIWDNTETSIAEKYCETNSQIQEQLPVSSFGFAAEYMMDHYFLDKINSVPLLTLKDKHVLVEMSYLNPPIQLFDILFELQLAGYQPVLAHPERYLFFHKDKDKYKKLKRAGCMFQLNLLSTVGYYGESVAKTADYLLKEGMIQFTGTDIHHSKHLNSFQKKIIIKETAPLKEALLNNVNFSLPAENLL